MPLQYQLMQGEGVAGESGEMENEGQMPALKEGDGKTYKILAYIRKFFQGDSDTTYRTCKARNRL